MKYQLYNPMSGEPMLITIDELAKEDFKEMMNWSEREWKYHTKEIKNKGL